MGPLARCRDRAGWEVNFIARDPGYRWELRKAFPNASLRPELSPTSKKMPGRKKDALAATGRINGDGSRFRGSDHRARRSASPLPVRRGGGLHRRRAPLPALQIVRTPERRAPEAFR